MRFLSGILSIVYGLMIYVFSVEKIGLDLAVLLSMLPMISWLIFFYLGILEGEK